MKSRIGVGISALFLSVILVFAFQNCGQNGAISEAGVGLSKSISDDGMEVILPADPTLPPVNNDDGAKNDIPKNDMPKKNPPTVADGGDTDGELPPVEDDGEIEVDAGGKCGNLAISSVNLSVDHVGLESGMAILSAEEDNLIISASKKSIKLKGLADASISKLNLVLNVQGNSVGSGNLSFPLKTPSGQQSGIKIHLDQSVEIKKDSMYELSVEVDLSKQIVSTKKKCIFKPVIKSATLL